ncbi:MAG: NAD(P)-binding protein [Gammaproteobacteria bacterium]
MTDSILIVGAGIAGLHAAAECANAGARAIVVERGPVIGGKLAATMTEASAIGDRAEGAGTPLFEALAENENIEIITLATLESVEGRPGNFTVSIRERERFVTDACTRCKLCRAVCPVVLPNEHDAGLTFRKAIYTPMAETMPPEYVIDIRNCLNTPPNYLPCQQCVDVCEDDAIHFHLPLDTIHERHVGAVILAPGFQIEDSANFRELGYGEHPDIVTSVELQRLLESPGPTGGYASKPSDEEYPDSILLVLDDPSHFGLYIVASQVHQLLAQDVETVAVLVLSQLNQDSEYEEVKALAEQTGVQVSWGTMFKVEPTDGNTLEISYEDFSAHRYVRETYDMVVLCSDVEPAPGLAELAETVGVDMADSGYIAARGNDGAGVATSQPGIFVAGCASGPKNIKDSTAAAHAAAEGALAYLDQRLLGADDVPPETAEATEPAAAPMASPPELSDDETRARIEQMLYALLDRADA